MKKAIHARDVPRPEIQTSYPEPFASLVAGRTKQKLGDIFGLTSFGVNLVRMAPSSTSTVRHHRSACALLLHWLRNLPALRHEANGGRHLRSNTSRR